MPNSKFLFLSLMLSWSPFRSLLADPVQFQKLYILEKGYFIAFIESNPPTALKNYSRELYFGKVGYENNLGWSKIYTSKINYTGKNKFTPLIYADKFTQKAKAKFYFDLIYGVDAANQPLSVRVTENFDTSIFDSEGELNFSPSGIKVQCEQAKICGEPNSDILHKVNQNLLGYKLTIVPGSEPVIRTNVFRVETFNDRYLVMQENLMSGNLNAMKFHFIKAGVLFQANVESSRLLIGSEVPDTSAKGLDPQTLKVQYNLKGGWKVEIMPDLPETKLPEFRDQIKFQHLIYNEKIVDAWAKDARVFKLLELDPEAAELVLKNFPEFKIKENVPNTKLAIGPCQLIF